MKNIMDVNIKRVDIDLPLPKYETRGSVGFDLICRVGYNIAPKHIALIPGNVIVEVPDGYMLMLALRSSTPRKLGLIMPQGVGVIDNDYCGEDDELLIQVYNISDEMVRVSRGDRIAQGVFVKVANAHWNEVDKMNEESRGGYGSTDSYY